jgi:hypothetical protein
LAILLVALSLFLLLFSLFVFTAKPTSTSAHIISIRRYNKVSCQIFLYITMILKFKIDNLGVSMSRSLIASTKYSSSTYTMFMTVHKIVIFYLKVRDIYSLYRILPKQNSYYSKRRQIRK